MRHDKAAQVLELARRLSGTSEGLTLDEMADALGVGRRTAERLRDAVWALFPQMEAVEDPPRRRFRIVSGLDTAFLNPSAEELAALHTAADSLAASGATARAEALYALERKLMAAVRGATRRRLAPDFEALAQAETIAVQAGGRPFEDPEILGAIRTAVKSLRALTFRYEGGSSPGREREVTPFGILFGRNNYLVAAEMGQTEPRTWRLDRMTGVAVSDRAAAPPADFSLQAFADQSFGIYQGAPEDVVLRITPEGAADALRWRFHAAQQVEPQPDGSVRVAFRAGGMLELAWHLFTWGDKVEIVSPPALRTLMVEELERALRTHRN
jgi:predicted DNA-binding transcriptional regulator YafY